MQCLQSYQGCDAGNGSHLRKKDRIIQGGSDEGERKSESDGEREMRYNRCQHLFFSPRETIRGQAEVNLFCLTLSAILETEAESTWDGEEAAEWKMPAREPGSQAEAVRIRGHCNDQDSCASLGGGGGQV